MTILLTVVGVVLAFGSILLFRFKKVK
ncbi:LPXTG cell wall anchor domain-containing protein [Streptococcus oralis]|nr:LPXTG cell wall anchor domain-containing protein [Streptococcus oralis]MCY7059951.1 LPXTG cell wall anchor domain-containing protein [Streptococcus oralis]MCY7080799.1 LPXTG cell wall anchor domain-containing protein [Streptococcus oralis]MCY7086007.1 LPXTG cell wall anchor domain-containing protein [Streptococcus oralis]